MRHHHIAYGMRQGTIRHHTTPHCERRQHTTTHIRRNGIACPVLCGVPCRLFLSLLVSSHLMHCGAVVYRVVSHLVSSCHVQCNAMALRQDKTRRDTTLHCTCAVRCRPVSSHQWRSGVMVCLYCLASCHVLCRLVLSHTMRCGVVCLISSSYTAQ